ncbi:hypothetical protein LCGC14_1125910 [marine sediment metagenome]|uniref:Uncharacterized protein n=1 Tax=marine sediment metagenome TaxID=412755 RepID=A0A0F9M798_9ZZZZ
MLIEFIGGKMDGEVGDVPIVYSSIKVPYCKPLNNNEYLTRQQFSESVKEPMFFVAVYHRKPATNKFYFDKIEEV